MNVVRWSPFREFDQMLRAMERTSAPVRRADWLPLVDIRESHEAYEIDVEVPAVAAEDLEVSVTERVLTVSGERKGAPQAEDAQHQMHRNERRYGKFLRSFQLPEDADVDSITANNRDGVLYLRIAKNLANNAKTIDVKVS